MKVIKAFGNDDSYYTLPPYDGSHNGNVNAWLEVVRLMKPEDLKLRKDVLRKIFEFSKNESDELGIISALFRRNMRYDVRVIWRRRQCALHMYSLKNSESS